MKPTFLLGLCFSFYFLSQIPSANAQPPNPCLTKQESNESDDSADITVENVSAETREFLLGLVARWDDTIINCFGLNGWTAGMNSSVDLTLGSNNVFGGLTASLNGYAITVPEPILAKITNGIPVDDNPSLEHSIVFSGGLQTDAAFQNLSLLIEAGYVPVIENILPDLSIGTKFVGQSSLIVGTYIQGGYTAALGATAAVSPAQEDETSVDSEGALLRFQLGGESEIILPLNLAEIQRVRMVPEAWLWYDVLDNRVYGLLEGSLTLDITESVSYNLISFKQGSPPPDFASGTQFSTGLTISF